MADILFLLQTIIQLGFIALIASILIVIQELQKMSESPIKNDICPKNGEYTREEVEKHVKPDDVWIIYNRKVYNMTPFYPNHPGGEALLKKAGKDATVVLHTIPAHATAFKTIEKKLAENCIGTLKY